MCVQVLVCGPDDGPEGPGGEVSVGRPGRDPADWVDQDPPDISDRGAGDDQPRPLPRHCGLCGARGLSEVL